jgi:hypothetical protein
MPEIKTVDELATERSELVTRNQESTRSTRASGSTPSPSTGRSSTATTSASARARQGDAPAGGARGSSRGVRRVDDAEDRDFEFIGSERGAQFTTRGPASRAARTSSTSPRSGRA